MAEERELIRQFWNRASCGEELYLTSLERSGFEAQALRRYQLEPYIRDFAKFDDSADLRVLEIGVGLGADHEQFARAKARLSGIDLTDRAIELTARRLALAGFPSDLRVGDAENLPFPDEEFDVVYSWGVIHHTPDTQRAIHEIHRVLKPGGEARIMIYSRWSMVGIMLWTRYALLRGRPFTQIDEIYAKHLESPGTKAYSVAGARAMFSRWTSCRVRTVLTHGDLLESEAGQRHRGLSLTIARALWPRWLVRSLARGRGLYMLIEARR